MENQVKSMSEELKKQFLSATETEKVAMLMAFAVHLTILMRAEYGASDRNAENYNETLHRITSQTLAMIVKSEERYPDDVFIDMLSAGAEHKGINPILEQAFAEGKSMVEQKR